MTPEEIRRMIDRNEDEALRRFPMLPRSERWPLDTEPAKGSWRGAMTSPAIGYRVRHTDGRYGHVVTHYDNGDHMVCVEGQYERWTDADIVWAGR